MTKTTTNFLHLLWEHLCSCTTEDDHVCLFRMARARGITGGPIHGWRVA